MAHELSAATRRLDIQLHVAVLDPAPAAHNLGDHQRQHLAVHQIRDPAVGDLERLIQAAEGEIQRHEQRHHPALARQGALKAQILHIVQQPAQRDRQRDQQQIEQLLSGDDSINMAALMKLIKKKM